EKEVNNLVSPRILLLPSAPFEEPTNFGDQFALSHSLSAGSSSISICHDWHDNTDTETTQC
ncbi:MAG: hypothetical protein ABF646_11840, partial [Acetobacter papayae]